ncbi:MAG: Rossmann-like and DUF2520 domain-containing protein [Acidimicrobiales bacterium]
MPERPDSATTRSVQIIGPGRAGQSLADALSAVGWTVAPLLGRADLLPGVDLTGLFRSIDVVVLAVPDDTIAEVARRLPQQAAPVLHLSGSRPLSELAPHARPGSLHPLVSLPNARVGSERLLDNCFFAVSGDPITIDIAESLGGRWAEVTDDNRARYHAAATVASNHAVALAAQVEALAASTGLEADPFYELMITTLESVRRLGPRAALTGPASRGDWDTIRSHLAAIEPDQRDFYRAAFVQALTLTSLTPPKDLA